MRRHRLLLGFVALIPTVAVASPTIVGTWDVTGNASVRYHYEGRSVRMNLPLRFTIDFTEEKTYLVSGIAVSCTPGGATLPDITGRWRIAGGSVRGTAGLAGAIRDAVEACVAGSHASVDAARSRFRVLPNGEQLEGRFAASLGVRYRQGHERETVRVLLAASLTGTRRAESAASRAPVDDRA
jgi:hypothetical protein